MPLICFAAQKGSPGVTSATLAVAATWRTEPGRRKVLLEADGSGGVLGLRYNLPSQPGLVTLAAAARAGSDLSDLWDHTRELPGGLPFVPCPDGAEQVLAALSAAGSRLGRALDRHPDLDVLCDLGRLAPDSPALDLAAEASAVLMVARPVAEQLQPAARRMRALQPRVRHLGWVLVGNEPYGPGEIEETFGWPVVGVLADDARAVEAIEQGVISRRTKRQPYVRSAAELAETLAGWSVRSRTSPAPDDDVRRRINGHGSTPATDGGDDSGTTGPDPLTVSPSPEPPSSAAPSEPAPPRPTVSLADLPPPAASPPVARGNGNHP